MALCVHHIPNQPVTNSLAKPFRAKEGREASKEAEAERVKQEKEMEVARLRAQQEKAQDRQAQVDELRAKRYQEAKDRAWRKTQLAIAQKKESMKEEIAHARELQRREKVRLPCFLSFLCLVLFSTLPVHLATTTLHYLL